MLVARSLPFMIEGLATRFDMKVAETSNSAATVRAETSLNMNRGGKLSFVGSDGELKRAAHD